MARGSKVTENSPSLVDVVSCGLGGLVLLLFAALASQSIALEKVWAFLLVTVECMYSPDRWQGGVSERVVLNGREAIQFHRDGRAERRWSEWTEGKPDEGSRFSAIAEPFQWSSPDGAEESFSFINGVAGERWSRRFFVQSRGREPEVSLEWEFQDEPPVRPKQITIRLVTNDPDSVPVTTVELPENCRSVSIRATRNGFAQVVPSP
jgi:hypothetical protein